MLKILNKLYKQPNEDFNYSKLEYQLQTVICQSLLFMKGYIYNLEISLGLKIFYIFFLV